VGKGARERAQALICARTRAPCPPRAVGWWTRRV